MSPIRELKLRQQMDLAQFTHAEQAPRNRKRRMEQEPSRIAKKRRTIPPSSSEPSIFTLNADCLDEIFDYISLADLCSVGRTCKRLYRVAGKYFARNYPFKTICMGQTNRSNGDVIQKIRNVCETNFAPYHFAAAHKYSNLKKIFFCELNNFSDDHFACIVKMNILAQVTTIELFGCSPEFCDIFLNRCLKMCTNLKNLMVTCSQGEGLNLEWTHQHVPTLERFEISGDCVYLESVDLQIFLQANPQIKRLSLMDYGSLSEIIRAVGMSIDEMEYIALFSIYSDQIKASIGEGHIKNLKLWATCYATDGPPLINDLEDINCLVSARIDCFDFGRCEAHNALALASFVNLRKLHFESTEISMDDAELLSKSLKNIEELHLGDFGSFPQAIPFARRLPELRIITALKKSKKIVDIKALISDRHKLPNAKILKIYLADEAYRQLRWTSTDLNSDLVKIKRFTFKGDEYL